MILFILPKWNKIDYFYLNTKTILFVAKTTLLIKKELLIINDFNDSYKFLYSG